MSLLRLRLRRGLPSQSVESAIGLGIGFEEGRTERALDLSRGTLRVVDLDRLELLTSPGGPWEFVDLLPLFDPPRHDSAETIRKALDLGVSVKMITGRRLGMGANMYPSTSLLGEHKDGSISKSPIDELIKKAYGFVGVFPGWYSHNFGLDGQDQVKNDGSECVVPVQQHNYLDLEMEYEASKVAFSYSTTTGTLSHSVSDGISFFLVCLIGRSLGLIYKGIRQSLADLGGQLILLGKASDGRVQRDFEGLTNLLAMADQPNTIDNGSGNIKRRLDGMSQMITSHDQQLQEILRLLRAQATASPSMSAAPVTQTGSAPTVHDPPAAPPVQA
ncbi:hypothetical protein Syun_017114 [Stephania yunnanensis]|uniref:Uncharacterized protein n=1 Tax=Stephania yunnanensis TaxID=152371 RepID=A0AAP0P226_9MAGN